MESRASSRARTAAEISVALERDEFVLYLQPHLDLRTMSVSGAEALIRWNHPVRGLVTPVNFIPFAEQHGLIRNVTRWVMAAALKASAFVCGIDPAFRLFFNLSAMDFADRTIIDDLRSAASGGAALANIGVELTETAAMQDLGTASRTVKQLQRLGVSVAIDDFGTGYSSLSLLKRLPVNIVKIDRSFISQVLHSKRDAAIAISIIAGGKNLGYETVAEGVETEDQLAWLRDHGCRFVQGYHVAVPQPLAAFSHWLGARVRESPVA
jgi:EAL domain-containing protein (putative c-di-GMP-specific phosphodiesterase class I)